MTDRPNIPEERLLAWFEGALPEAEAARLEAEIAEDSAAQDTIADWRRQNEALRALYGPAAAEPVPPRLSLPLERAPRPRWTGLAALLAVAVVSGAIGWGAAGLRGPATGPRQIAEAAIAAHDTFVVEVVHPVEVDASDAAHLVGWVSNRLGHQVAPPDFAAQGFRLMGGRVLPGDTGAAALFMYENDLGRRVTLYVAPPQQKVETAFQFAETGATQSFYWTSGDLAYAVVGDVARETLRKIALAAYDQLI